MYSAYKFDGARLRHGRKLTGKTQTAVAQECKVTLVTYRRWEANATTPPISVMFKLIQAVQVSLAYMFHMTDDVRSPWPLTTEEIDAIYFWRNAPQLGLDGRKAFFKLKPDTQNMLYRVMIDSLRAQETMTGEPIKDEGGGRLKAGGRG